jgi:uncharacterized protein
MNLRRRSTRVLAFGSLCLLTLMASAAAPQADDAWYRDLLAWRQEHAAELQKPDGWLALAGLEWIEPGDTSFGSSNDNKIHLPAGGPDHLGVLQLQGTTVSIAPPPGGFPRSFLIDGKPAQRQELHTEPDNDKHNPRMTIGALNVYVVRRGDKFALRIKDAKSAALVGFHGLKWYPPRSSYRVIAHWTPYLPQKTITLDRMVGASYQEPVPGVAAFTLGGKKYQLEPVLEDPAVAKLFFILRDKTSTSTTYGACRFLYTGFPSNGLEKEGELVLDFNHLENPPCAYTPYATCPLPPKQNRLLIPLPVGELRYHP